MDKKPLIGIVVPVYNASNYIEETIKSVLSQDYTNWELWLVNDCSSDDTVSKIEPFLSDTRIHLINSEQNYGAAKSRNIGIEKTEAEVLTFIDSDDIWLPTKLSDELEFMIHNDAGFVFTAYEFGDENAKGTGKIVSVPTTLTYKEALSRTIIFTSTVMVDLTKVPKEIIFMPQVPSEDTATWWQILKSGNTAYGLNKVLTVYRRPQHTLSSNKLVAMKRIWNLYRKVEKLNVFSSAANFVMWAFRATMRRI